MKHELLLSVLEAARVEPIGIILMVSDITAARAALYAARAKANNPEYSDLQFRQWPYDEGNLVICHNQRPQAQPTNLGAINLSGVLDLNLDD